MKKQYIAAMACLVAGAIGFIGIYSLEKNSEKENQIVQEEVAKAPEVKVTETAKVIKPKIKDLLPENTEEARDKEEEKNQENTEKKDDTKEMSQRCLFLSLFTIITFFSKADDVELS